MTPEQWQEAKSLFHDALERPESERTTFVHDSGAPEEVRAEVARLLDQHRAARTFLETPAAALEPGVSAGFSDWSPDSAPAASRSPLPPRIGPYRILGVLGEGGMGVVYLAEQESPKRTVALKVIRPGLASEAMLRRFEHEAAALARLQHPAIAQIFHAGTERGEGGSGRRPYFAMELVNGEPLLAYAASHRLATRERITLFIQVCDAVQHAHIKGVIHRDLKPGNIIVADGAPAQTPSPKVLDFGVARLTDSDLRATIQTGAGQIVGTVPYMSPEQIAGDAHDLDTRSDVYSLGVVLFELLTGRLPYELERKSIIEAARLIREHPPARLSSASRSLRGDLEVIVGKALEKDKHRRYQSAADLAADLARYLRREPITARPPSAAYQFRTFVSRNRALVAGTCAVVLVLAVALTVSLMQRNLARRNENRATALNSFFMGMLGAANPEKRHGQEMTVKQMLDVAADNLARQPSGNPQVDEETRLTLGTTYRLIGELNKAEPLLREAAARAGAALGPDDETTLEALNTLALNLVDRDQMAEAGPLFKRVYQSRLRLLGEQDPATLSAMNNYARWLDASGEPSSQEQGLALMDRAVRIRTRLLGSDDRKTLISVDNLGRIYFRHGRLDEAERCMRRANDGFRRTLGENDPDTLASYQNLAELALKQRRFPEALEFARLAAEGRARVLGMDDRFTLYSINTRGRVLLEWEENGKNHAAEAEPFLRQSLEGVRRVSQPDELYVPSWGVTYARCLTALSRFDEAQSTLQDCQARLEAIKGDTSRTRAAVTRAYVELYTAWSRPADADAWKSRLPPVK